MHTGPFLILAATVTLPTLGWIAVFIGMGVLAWFLMILSDALHRHRQRRKGQARR